MLKLITIVLCVIEATSSLSASLGEHDLSLHLYTEDGQVAQLAYATRAVSQGLPGVGFMDEESGCVALFTANMASSSLALSRGSAFDVTSEGSIVCLTAGYKPDCTYLLNQMNVQIQNHCLTFGEPPNLDHLGSELSQWMTRGMYRGTEDPMSRPLAASLMIAMYDGDLKRNRLMQVDNTGYINDRRLAVLGALSESDKSDLCTAVLPSDADLGEQTNLQREGKDILERWLRKCEKCAAILLKESAYSDRDRNQGCDVSLDCCVVDPAGKVHRSPHTLMSVNDTIAWIRSTVRAQSLVVNILVRAINVRN